MKKTTLLFFLSGFFLSLFTQCSNPSDMDEPANSFSADVNSKQNAAAAWKISIQMKAFHLFPFFAGIEKAYRGGINYVEPYPGQLLRYNSKSTFDINMSLEDRLATRQLLQSKGIKMSAFGVVTPKTMDEWKKTFEFAKDMDIDAIIAEPLRDQWDDINHMALEFNIRVCIYAHNTPGPYWRPDSVLAAIKNRPYLGACANVSYWNKSGLDAVKSLKRLNGYVFGFYLKDVKDFGKNSEDALADKEITNMLSELKRQNYNGFITMEHEGDAEENIPNIIEKRIHLQNQINELMK